MPATVLVVDDDPSFSSLASRILHTAGLQVVGTAVDAATALETARSLQPDGVLVDVGLPDRDGFDLARDLVALPWRPIVVLTSSDRDAAPVGGRPDPDEALPFIPKEDLGPAALRRLLGG